MAKILIDNWHLYPPPPAPDPLLRETITQHMVSSVLVTVPRYQNKGIKKEEHFAAA